MPRRRRHAILVVLLLQLVMFGGVDGTADESPILLGSETETAMSGNERSGSSRLNVPLKTAGGTQFWTDHLNRQGYRVQQNSLTGHWRLLDPADIRRAWGSREDCVAALERLRPVPATESERHVVVLLHGLMRTRHCMGTMEKSLSDAGYNDVIRFSYASTRSSISDHAAALRELLEDLPPQTRISFVGHSMGNIVVRHLIGDLQRDGDPAGILPRTQAMVMLGPPNQGAAIARRLAPTGLFEVITGRGGMELGPQWESVVEKLATPPFPFLIVAGDISSNRVQNPLLEGAGDFIVCVDEARLEGAEAFHTLPVLHSFLMKDPTAIQLSVEFIAANDHREP